MQSASFGGNLVNSWEWPTGPDGRKVPGSIRRPFKASDHVERASVRRSDDTEVPAGVASGRPAAGSALMRPHLVHYRTNVIINL
jgi:hypothetical protein